MREPHATITPLPPIRPARTSSLVDPLFASARPPAYRHPSMSDASSQPLLPHRLADLRHQALAAAANAYAPYSRFRVGAALLLAPPHTEQVVTGCNVENASYRLTTCAEQAAIANAVTHLGPGIRLLAVAIANLNNAASMPCGACRQTLLEFSPDPTLVTVLYPGLDPAGAVAAQRATLADLLPAAFRLAPL